MADIESSKRWRDQMENTYWNDKGTHQYYMKALEPLIPFNGSIKGRKNVKLEKLRKAINCYWDLYNNGLGNRDRSFSKIFGHEVLASHITYYIKIRMPVPQRYYEAIERVMDGLIEDAALEQLLNY
jgi:hypothetical protein